jgi:hypothetical protein
MKTRWTFMKFWSVTTPPASRIIIGGFASLGLVVLAAMPVSYAVAEDAPKPAAATAAKSEPSAPKQPAAVAAKSDAPSAKSAKPVQPAKAKAKPATNVGTAECVRTGQRVIAALARDDSGAASQFHTFYTAFMCSPQHLAQAFGCLVNLQSAHPGLSNPTPEQVTQCWEDPLEMPAVLPQQGADGAGDKH